MVLALFVLRVALATVFAVAAAAKLADVPGTRRAVAGFGVPERLSTLVGVGLPLVELTVAFLLLPSSSARAGALCAVGLLGAFCVAIALNLARGRTPECHCFGQLHSEPIGVTTLARNAVMAGAASFVAIAGRHDAGPSAIAWIGRLGPSGVVALTAGILAIASIVASVLVVTHILRSHGRLLLRVDRLEAALRDAGVNLAAETDLPARGLPIGSPAPAFALETTDGGLRQLNDVISTARLALLVFTDPGCGPCRELMPAVAQWQRDHERDLAVAVISAGTREAVSKEAGRANLRLVMLDTERKVYDAYQGAGTPCAVLVARDGTIASPVVAGRDHIRQLLADALRSTPASPAGLPVGTAAPDVVLESMAGESLSVQHLGGRESVLVFWNPSCGYCRGMHAQLLEAERRAATGEAQVVIVSAGEREVIRAEGFRSLVLLDRSFAAGTAFKAAGTPAAVAIDASGNVASQVHVGSSEVLSLIAGRAVEREIAPQA